MGERQCVRKRVKDKKSMSVKKSEKKWHNERERVREWENNYAIPAAMLKISENLYST